MSLVRNNATRIAKDPVNQAHSGPGQWVHTPSEVIICLDKTNIPAEVALDNYAAWCIERHMTWQNVEVRARDNTSRL